MKVNVLSYKKMLITLMSMHIVTPLYAASQYKVECPPQIEVAQQLKTTPSGWRLFTTKAKHYLNNVMMYSGRPEEMASLKPDFTDKAKASWQFSANDETYIVCEYEQTSIQLTRQLYKNTKGCTVKYDQTISGGKGYIPKSIECTQS